MTTFGAESDLTRQEGPTLVSVTLPGGMCDSGFASLGRAFFLGLEWMSVNKWSGIFLTLEKLANSTAKAIPAQQQLFNSLAKVVLDNHIAFDYVLAEQGVVCVITYTSCCTCINGSGEVQTQLHKIQEQGQWLQQISCDDPWSFDLFSWLPLGLGSWFRAIIQTGFKLFLILLCILVKFCTCWMLNLCKNDLPNKVMLAGYFKMISNTYDLDKIQTLNKKSLRVLPNTLFCYSLWHQEVYHLCTFPLRWDRIPREVLSWYWGIKVSEVRKPDSGPAMLSEKDLDQKGKCGN